MNSARNSLILCLLFPHLLRTLSAPPAATKVVPPDLERIFPNFDGALVLYQLSEDRTFRYNPDRCSERLLPASTFKIMNALVGLETGVVPDQDFVLPWDGTEYEIPEWNQDHSLKTAFQNSVVWYYQEVARRVGPEEMQHYLDAAGVWQPEGGQPGRPVLAGWHTEDLGRRAGGVPEAALSRRFTFFKTLVGNRPADHAD